jgi:hypothetical protein
MKHPAEELIGRSKGGNDLDTAMNVLIRQTPDQADFNPLQPIPVAA